ncbi:MAG: RraA family protein [Planctomycetota bacterium]|nr:RraA family protein [Planctomycetota bacterium]
MSNVSTMPKFTSDQSMAEWVSAHLYTAVVSDALDSIGLRHQCLSTDIRPLDESLILTGRAKTALWEAVDPSAPRLSNPYSKEIEYLDSGQAGQVFVMSVGRHPEIVPWGELLSTACKVRGARGLLTDGLVRDSRRILEMKLPVFCTGRRPLDSAGRGHVVEYDAPIVIDSVTINPGDFVVADADGVVIIPKSVEQSVLSAAWAKVLGENRTRDALLTGRLLREVYEEFGVL